MAYMVSGKALASSSTYPVGSRTDYEILIRRYGKQHVPHLNRWFSFCSENELQPLNADVTSGAEFLTQYFRKSSCEYSSVNTARSDLSSVVPAVNGFN